MNMRIRAGILALIGGCFLCADAALAQEVQTVHGIPVTETQEQLLDAMTLEEKVAQMFFITPEALTGASPVTGAGEQTRQCYSEYPVGGIIYFQQNLLSREQISDMLEHMQQISMERTGLPVFLAVDEEGGRVSRLYGAVSDIPYVGDMYTVGTTGDPEQAYVAGNTIGTYLKSLHFNVDFAPVADIYSNPENTVIGDRAFGSDAATVSDMVPMAVKGLQDAGIEATLKHFPGHGDTAADSHSGYASSSKSLEELEAFEWEPFRAGIEAGAGFVMVGHISLPVVLGDRTPASLSSQLVSRALREELGFRGIIITDALNMGAIAANYSSAEAAVKAVQAGADMLLMPEDFFSAYEAVCRTVREGEIPETRINESVLRILQNKEKLHTD